MDIGETQVKAVWTLPSIYKIAPGGSYFFANYCCLNSFFSKELQSHTISSTFVLQVICFTTSIKINVSVELTRNAFSYEANEFSCETSLQNWIPYFENLYLVENSTLHFFENFQRPYPPLNKKIYFDVYNDSYWSMLLTPCRIWWKLQWVFSFKFPRITKKIIIQRNIPLRTITPRNNPLSMYSQVSQILDQTPSFVTFPHVIEGPYAL